MAQSQILSIPSGFLNVVNNPVVGMNATPGGTGLSLYQGQLGKWCILDDAMAAPMWNTAVGNGYGGRFQYVRLAAAAAVPVIGQMLFWDVTVAPNLFQVTTSETQSTDAAVEEAGICLSTGLTVGNYTIIQTNGLVYGKFRAALTSAGAIGSAVYTAAAGGADLGFLDVINTGGAPAFSDVSKMQRRYLGPAFEAPTNGGLKRFYLNFTVRRD